MPTPKLRLYCLHGFLGKSSDWDFLHCDPELTALAQLEAVDIVRVRPPTTWGSGRDWARAFSETLRPQRSAARNAILGYSLGARLAMHLLREAPEFWAGAVLVAGHPGLKSEAEKTARAAWDEQWARRFETLPWDTLVAEWESLPVFGGVPLPWVRREQDFDRRELAAILRNGSLARQEDLAGALEVFPGKLFYIAGERDLKYIQIARDLTARNPNLQHWAVPGCAHRVPWEAPEDFTRVLKSWLTSLD